MRMVVPLTTLALAAFPEAAAAGSASLLADVRNCSLVTGGEDERYEFVADGGRFKWKHDPSQCLAPASTDGCRTAAPWACAPTAIVLRPCSAAGTSWTRVPVTPAAAGATGGFLLSPQGNSTLCLRAQPNFGAALLLPCFDDPWNAKLHSELSHPHSFHAAHALDAAPPSNPCCDKQPCGSAVCSKAVCAACPASLGHCPQLEGTAWRLDDAGRLVANMSNPLQIARPTQPVCSHFEGCLGVLAPPSASTLQPLAWQPIPLSTPLSPTEGGWMHAQLVAQRAGFGGHEYPMAGGGVNDLHTVWRDEWLGGGFASGMGGDLAEGYPYWLNGLVPLVALLNDTSYIEALHAQLEHILSNASAPEDKQWLGPLDERSTGIPRGSFDFWLQYRMMGSLTQYAELAATPSTISSTAAAGSAAADPATRNRTVQVLLGFATALDELLDDYPIVIGDWSHSRMNELLAPLLWLVDHAAPATAGAAAGDGGHNDDGLDAVFRLIGKFQSQGFSWSDWILSPGFPDNAGALCGHIHYERLPVHGVDIGTGMMQEGHLYRITGDGDHLRKGKAQLDALMARHGQANGVFGANECLADRDPSKGTETCVVVEMMESMAQMWTASGDLSYLDQLEKIAFNAMPAPFFNGSMGAMKYFQETNHFVSDRYSQVYECCLTNHNMGWPKYAQRAVMTSAASEETDTLAVLLYHAFSAKDIPLPSGSSADLTVETDYPFDEQVTITVTSDAGLGLALRIPAWAHGASVALANGTVVSAQAGTLFRTRLQLGTVRLVLSLPMTVRLENRTDDAVAVHRGPLLYSYNVKWNATHSEERPDGQCAGLGLQPVPANATFLCDIGLDPMVPVIPSQISISNMSTFRFARRPGRTTAFPFGRGVFSSFLVPVSIEVTSPAGSNGHNFSLIPFGATDLRITELLTAAALPAPPPPVAYPITRLVVSGPDELPFLPTAFKGNWPPGQMNGPAVTDNSQKDDGFITIRSGSPNVTSTVLILPKISTPTKSSHRLAGISVGVRYETGYAGVHGADLTIVATSTAGGGQPTVLLEEKNLTGYAFNDCHEKRCYSPVLNGSAVIKPVAQLELVAGRSERHEEGDAGEESDVDDMIQLEIRFVNRDLNLQLLLPFEFELTWVPR